MAEFLDHQAIESEGSSDNDDQPIMKKRKLKESKEKTKKKRKIESSDEDEDDDEDDARAAEEMKGFIADEEEEEGPEDDDDKSEKSNQEELDELDEDDLDLIEENMDAAPNKPKRIVATFDSDEEEDDRTAIQRKLFGGGDDDDEEPAPRRDLADDRLSGSEEEGSEDNFIVNEDGDRPKKRYRHRKDLNIPEGALDEARDIFGVEEFDLNDFYDDEEEGFDEEEEEILDEDADGEPIRRVRKKEKKVTIYDSMDPVELERGFLSGPDRKIMLEDRPERFQLRKTQITEVDEAELEIETKWIIRYAFSDDTHSRQRTKLPNVLLATSDDPAKKTEAEGMLHTTIKEIIRFIRNQCFEIPFITFYRKEFYNNCLSVNEMWKIYEYDEKWCHLQQRKSKIMELMKRMQTFQVESQSAKKRIVAEADIHDLHAVDSELNLADVYSQFQLFHGMDVGKMLEWERARKGDSDPAVATKFKYSNRVDKYQFCADNGIGEFACRFGLTPRQFGDNLDWKRHECVQDPMSVDEVTEEYVSSVFPQGKDVLEAGVFMVAKELSRQPMVREKIRRAFLRRVALFVSPTKAGRTQLDESHPVYYKRYLKSKPIHDIADEDFLYFHKLKEAGLLNVRLRCDNDGEIENKETLGDEVLVDGPYKSDDYTELAENWNKIREMTVKRAVNEMLIPVYIEELEKQLLEEAQLCVAEKCAENLAKRIESQGFKPLKDDEEDHEFTRLGETRILAIAYPDDINEASFGALVNEDGNVVDYVRMVHLLKRQNPHMPNLPVNQMKKDALEQFKKMVERKRPHVIGLCADNLEAIRLKKDLENAIYEMVGDNQIPHEIQVVFVECDYAKVYMNSKQGLLDFPDYPPVLRMAISAARYLVDPLIEMSSFWNADEDFLCIPFHPLQKDVPKELLVELLEREMINRVCEVGVDINRCLDNPHHQNLVRFVAGLGPRKAVFFLKEVRQTTQVLGSRTCLVTHAKMGPKVFMNSAGFIKIEQQRISDRTDEYVEVLDGSRVHPETYEWARKMAVDALEVDDNADPQAAIEELMNAPERLKDLDLDAFAEELERQGFGEKRATLYDIAKELHERYKDRRRPFEPMSTAELHEILARDMKDTLKQGKLVQATVTGVQYRRLTEQERDQTAPVKGPQESGNNEWLCQYCSQKRGSLPELWDHVANQDSRNGGCLGVPVGVRVRIDNGFQGFIPNKLISDNPNTFKNPLERVQIGKMLWCRIQSVDFEKMSILLSCRTSDLQQDDIILKDSNWDIDLEMRDKENDQLDQRRRAESNTVIKRVIQHHAFQNISYQEAIRLLSNSEQGECIIRPSSKSADRLTATWKVAEGVYANVDIQEENKENIFSLGRRLIINGEDFEDLNEIIARHISPMASFARDIVLFKYYLDGVFAEDSANVEQRLRDERRKNPQRIPYVLTPSTKYPGKFMISFAHPKYRQILHEYMTVTPEGIRFRQRVFTSFDQLLNWFKAHFNEMPAGSR